MEFVAGRLVADAEALRPFAFALGNSPVCWRQGLKHDAAAVMELTAERPDGPFRNAGGEVVDVEPDFVFPLLKGSDLRKPPAGRPRRGVIVTQRSLGEDTTTLSERAPLLWDYLRRHEVVFASRKSSIYRGRPPFSLFGIGPYSFAPWKVAVSGLHHPPAFALVGPVGGRPVQLDDTCYLLPGASASEAALLAALYGDAASLGLIAALSFPGSKRRLTKGLLQRLDLSAILKRADRPALVERAHALLAANPGRAVEPPAAIGEELERLETQFRGGLPDRTEP
jgi:hypothetical protein